MMARAASSPGSALPTPLLRFRSILHCLLVIGCTLGVYGQILAYDFLTWDDEFNFTQNPYLDNASWDSVVHFWRETYFSRYMPVSFTLYCAEARLAQFPADEFGKPRFNPAVFHAGNLLLHVACALLVYHLLIVLLEKPGPACLGALLFALHPLQVESVAWLSNQCGLLSAMFSLLALCAYVRLRAGLPPDSSTARSSSRHPALTGSLFYLAACVACLAALLSKPSAVSLPLMALAMDAFALRRSWKASLLLLLPWLIMAGSVVWLTRHEQPEIVFVPPPLWSRPLIAGDAISFYLMKIVWPTDLAIQYPRAAATVLKGQWMYVAWLIPSALLCACYRFRRSGPWLLAAAWFLAALAPVLGLMPFGYQYYSIVADRYVYLALFAPALAAGWCLAVRRSQALYAAAGLVLLLCAALSYVQASRWQNSFDLYTHTLKINPDSDIALSNIVIDFFRREDFQSAIPYLQRWVHIEPGSMQANLNLATALFRVGNYTEAADAYRAVLQLDPNKSEARVNLGACYSQLGDYRRAVLEFRRALDDKPDNSPARFNLALALEKSGAKQQAIDELEELISRDSTHLAARMKLGSLLETDHFEQAIQQYREAIGQHPEAGDARGVLAMALAKDGRCREALAEYRILYQSPSRNWPLWVSQAAWILATNEDPDIRNGQEALHMAEAACQQTARQSPPALMALAAAYAESGRFPQAVSTAEAAHEAARRAGQTAMAEAASQQAQQYRANKPWREHPRRSILFHN